MNEFDYVRAGDAAEAIRLAGERPHAKYLGGGTNLIDLMREGIERPENLIDVTHLSREIATRDDGSLVLGAAAKNTRVAADPVVRERFPMLTRAIVAGASGQIRNMATVGGNIMQRTRCLYFYDDAARCNKRTPGSGCDAMEGFNRFHAILGGSETCVATHPSDMCVALVALDASVHLQGPQGTRSIKLAELHRLPGRRPDVETELGAGELIVAVELPPLPAARGSTYRKVRDRSSYAFALVSVAAALEVGADDRITDVRLALGGVGTKPWRALAAEEMLKGAPAREESFRKAAEVELLPALGLRENSFKIELAKRTIVHTLAALRTGETA